MCTKIRYFNIYCDYDKNDLFIQVLIFFVSLIFINLLYLFIFFLFDLGKKVIFSENSPGMDIISLCLKLKQRNKMIYETENSIHKVYFVYIIFFYEAILQEKVDIIIN